jgi:AcrR family transcriptional regulator
VEEDEATHNRSGARVPKQQRSRETQEGILMAALAVFAERGYDGATMRRIAERSRVGQPLVAYHFTTKEALWLATVEWALGRFLVRIGPLIEALEGLDPATKLSLIFQQFTRYSAGTPELFQVLLDANKRGGPGLARVAEDQLRPTFERLRQLIASGQKAGTVPAGDTALIYYALVAIGSTLFSLNREFELLTGRDPRDPKVVEAQAQLLVRLFFPSLDSSHQKPQEG